MKRRRRTIKAKDTVVKIKCHCELLYKQCDCLCDDCSRIKLMNQASEAQAEISFKAGENQGYQNGHTFGYNTAKQEALESHFEGLKAGRKAGIKEVVEWLQKYAIHGGKVSLDIVLFDMEAHSPFIGKSNSRNGV